MPHDKRVHDDTIEEGTQQKGLTVSKRLRTSNGKPVTDPGKDDQVNDSPNSSSIPKENLEFEVLQQYRQMDKDFSKLKAITMRGDGDISTVLNNLSTLNQLFDDVQIVKDRGDTTESLHTQNSNNSNSNNNIFAYDSRAIVNISELAQLNVKNLQFGEIKSMLNLNDLILFIKRYLLKEYLDQNNIIISDTSLSNIEIDGRNGHSNNDDKENTREHQDEEEDDKGDQYTEPISTNLQKHVKRQQYLEQFDKFNKFNQFNWFKMGSIFKNYNQSVSVTDHLLGPFSLERKKRSINNNNRHALNNEQEDQSLNPASRQTAENVTRDDLINNQDLTTPEQVIKCYKLLLNKVGYNSKISLFKFILNPNSFAKSVENLFYTSFLIKDGRLVLEPDSNDSEDYQGFPVLRIKPDLKDLTDEEREIERQKRLDAQQNHIIFQLDMETWQKLVQKFNITESFIP